MEDPVLTVERLLRLSTSSNEGEATAAACAAARLINKHGLVIVRATNGGKVTFPSPSPGVRAKASSTRTPVEADSEGEEAQRMRAKYAGFCRVCSKHILKNEPIMWRRGDGAYHPKCFVELQAES